MARRKLPRSVTKRRWIKGLFWTIIFGCLFLSIVAIGRVGVINAALKEETEETVEAKEIPNHAASVGAQSFAENFATHYFHWGTDKKKERERRLERYLAVGLDPQAGVIYDDESMKWKSTLIKSQVWNIEETGEQSAVITLRILHRLEHKGKTSDVEGEGSHIKYFAVPVTSDGDNFVVHELPYFVPEPKKPDIEIQKDEEKKPVHHPNLKNEITEFLNTFFKAYTEGSTQELSYYTKGFHVIPFDEILRFEKIEDVNIYGGGNRFDVQTEVIIAETHSNTHMIYPFSMELIKEDGRWIVVNMDHNY